MKTTLYIVSNSYRKKLLLQNKELVNNKYMTLEELKRSYYFDYDDSAIYYLMKSENIKYDVAKNYILNMYLLCDNNKITSKKVEYLNQLKSKLEEEKLLFHNYLFKDYLKHVNVIVYGYVLNKSDMKLLDSIRLITNVEVNSPTNGNYIPKVYAYSNIEDEVVGVATFINKLLKETSLNHIKVAYFKEYEYIIRLVFDMFNLPFSYKDTSVLYGTSICKEWIATLKATKDREKTYEEMTNKYGLVEPILKLIDISNDLVVDEVCDIYLEYFISKCKTTYLSKQEIDGIKSINFLDDEITDDDYVFVLGCNLENMPKIYKDEDYLSDNIKVDLNIDTSIDLNRIERELWKNKITTTKNLVMTYKLKTPFDSYMKSLLIKDYPVCLDDNNKYIYSNVYNKICLARKLDNMIKYNISDSDTDLLYKMYPNIEYQVYDNKFKGISEELVNKYLKNKVHLSYSSMNNYYLCGFRYYIANLLKLDIYEENFQAKIGTMYHYILSKSIEENFDFEKVYNSYVNNMDLKANEKFFVANLKEELKFVIDTLSFQSKFTTFKNVLCESEININLTSNIHFKGIIDKILYKETSDELLVSIVDYKTGTKEVNIMNIENGLEMQLPIYVYLLKHSDSFRNAKIVGFYLQKILNKNFSYSGNDYLREKRRKLRLDGYSTSNVSLLEQFDTTYVDSELIKGMKVGKNGFSSYAKVLNDKQIENMSDCVNKKIKEAGNKILKGEFDINPKRIDGELLGCNYCKFQDICYKTEKNIIDLEKNNSLDFLGGE